MKIEVHCKYCDERIETELRDDGTVVPASDDKHDCFGDRTKIIFEVMGDDIMVYSDARERYVISLTS